MLARKLFFKNINFSTPVYSLNFILSKFTFTYIATSNGVKLALSNFHLAATQILSVKIKTSSRLYIDANWHKLRFSMRGMLTPIGVIRANQLTVNMYKITLPVLTNSQ